MDGQIDRQNHKETERDTQREGEGKKERWRESERERDKDVEFGRQKDRYSNFLSKSIITNYPTFCKYFY